MPPTKKRTRAAGPSPRKRAETNLKRYDALMLWMEGHLGFEEIGRRLGVSRARAHQLAKEGMEEFSRERHDLSDYARDRELGVVEMEIREAVEYLAKACTLCKGAASGVMKRCDHCQGTTFEPKTAADPCLQCNGQGVSGDWCRRCKATGNFYPPELRLGAIDRIQRSSDRRAKLLKLYTEAPPDLPYERDFYAELERLTDEELMREIEMLRVPVADKPKRRKSEDEAVALEE